ncbi:nucleolin-like [Belonocnema kinseyi]|uniref:nucleolin-like n=1 Tax=Belonocnema kinseyi TaxID=2817044 RepID=UPI00143CDCFB|nr:nucleolin-like [Belonocnema kinseyi]XP_033213375.1 nucleolin-like [Belonocnema kinseyi]
MKLVAMLALLCCLTISVLASPVPEKVESKVIAESAKETGRQVAPVSPAVPSSDEDDDDDDDDDVDLDITSDDDDDEEEDDDDDDDGADYIERFIEDILGGEDDDDDDDDNAVEAPVVPASPVVQQAAPAPAIPASVQADLNAVTVEESADEASSEAASEADTSTYDEETADVVPEGQAAATIQEASVEGADSIASPIALNQVPAAAAPAASAEDDDDDDDDDDDVDLDITEDDDDDDDEEEDDDDDDDDDDVVGDIADARKAREFKGKTKKHTNLRKQTRKSATHSSRMLDAQPSGDVSAIYVSKYNRFVDNILGRINKILRANYDPVTVKLTNPNSSTKSNKNKSKKNKKKTLKRKSNKKGTRKSAPKSATTISDNDVGEFRLSTLSKKMEEELEGYTSPDATTTPMMQTAAQSANEANKRLPEITTIRSVLMSRGVPSPTSGNKKKNKTKNKNRTKIGTMPTSKPTPSINNNKNKAKKNKPKAKATLYGLASLQRSGDVSVNMMSDHTTIKTKFSLGPLMLKVEKEFGRAAKKELRSATATTAEMSGKLSLRVLHGGAATLHSIRVLQPKQVRVESADDHDRTREFVWKRSSHIAHLVSQKLSSATRSMLRPPPVPVPTV